MQSLNIEEALCQWLGAKLPCPVVADVPEERPDVFVSIERVGGTRRDIVVDNPSIAIQCWSTSRLEAAELAYEVDGILPDFRYSDPRITSIERDALYNHPDLKGKKPRYQIVVDITTA